MSPTSKTIKNFEIKTIEYKGIQVTYQINYDTEEISIVEKDYKGGESDWTGKYIVKKWEFKNRGIEYMRPWIEIVNALEYAISVAADELVAYKREMQKNVVHEEELIDVRGEDVLKSVLDAGIKVIYANKKKRSKGISKLSKLYKGKK